MFGLRIFGIQESVQRGTETGRRPEEPARREWGGQETGLINGMGRRDEAFIRRRTRDCGWTGDATR